MGSSARICREVGGAYSRDRADLSRTRVPQDVYPFPRDDVAYRWQQEIETPGIDCYVVLLDGTVVGFAAVRRDEFLHYGIAGHPPSVRR